MLEAHQLERDVAGEDHKIGPGDFPAVFLLDRPQEPAPNSSSCSVDDRRAGGEVQQSVRRSRHFLLWPIPTPNSPPGAMRSRLQRKGSGAPPRRATTSLYEARRRFWSVAHLWGAWSIREGQFVQHPEIGYNGRADFQSFLAEAEILRQWGQSWRPPRAKSEPPLPPRFGKSRRTGNRQRVNLAGLRRA